MIFRIFLFWILFLHSQSVFADIGSVSAENLIKAARSQINSTLTYNPAYQKIPYPMGDVPLKEGVCTDVIIRAFRNLGIDLQKLIHEDIRKNGHLYPKNWGMMKPDSNIDHRRVPNLIYYFKSQGMEVDSNHFSPGDIIVWDLGHGTLHIGILSDKKRNDHFLAIHNICCGAKEEDIFAKFPVIAHFRLQKTFIKSHQNVSGQ